MEHLELTTKSGLAALRLARPKVNAMSSALLGELGEALEALACDDAIRGVLLSGAGSCFSAGLDLMELVRLDDDALPRFLDTFDRAFGAAFRFPKPMAVAVHGHAVAGGLVLALAGDHLALGEGDYQLGLTELSVGVPFPPVAYEIVRHAASDRARRALVFGAGTHPPAEVFGWGVGDALCADPLAEARSWLEAVCARPAVTFARVKAMDRAAACARIDDVRLADRRGLVAAILAARGATAGVLG